MPTQEDLDNLAEVREEEEKKKREEEERRKRELEEENIRRREDRKSRYCNCGFTLFWIRRFGKKARY